MVAGTSQQYRDFVRKQVRLHGMNPMSFRQINSPEQYRGMRGALYALVGTFSNNRLYRDFNLLVEFSVAGIMEYQGGKYHG